MSTFPTHVTVEQLGAVCQVLGLPEKLVTNIHVSATDGVSVTLQVLDPSGRIITQADGEVLTAAVLLPLDLTERQAEPVNVEAPAAEEAARPACQCRRCWGKVAGQTGPPPGLRFLALDTDAFERAMRDLGRRLAE